MAEIIVRGSQTSVTVKDTSEKIAVTTPVIEVKSGISNITGGTGDVVGPASAVDGNISLFDGVTGKQIKDSLKKLSDFVETTRTVNGKALSGDITLNKTDIGLGSVPNVDATNADNITSGTLDGDRLPAMSTTKKGAVPATGTPSGKILSDAGTWVDRVEAGGYTGQALFKKSETDYDTEWKTATAADVAYGDGTVADQLALIPNKADKVTGATAGNLAGLDEDGNLTDSGKKAADFEIAGAATSAVNAHLNAFAHGDIAHSNRTDLNSVSGTNTGDETAQRIGNIINGATEKTAPIDADMVGLMDSAETSLLKKLSWANIKATLTIAQSQVTDLVNDLASKAAQMSELDDVTLNSKATLDNGKPLSAKLKREWNDVNLDIFDSNLLAYWKFDGNFYDSVNQNHLYGSNSPSFVSGGKSGGQCLDLEADNNQWVYRYWPTFNLSSHMTFLSWIKQESQGTANYSAYSYGTANQWRLYVDGTTLKLDLWQSDGTLKEVSHQTAVTNAAWHLIGFVADGSNLILYLDGVACTTPTAYDGTIRCAPGYGLFTIGEIFDGVVSDTLLYNDDLFEDTITDLYNSGNGKFPTESRVFSLRQFTASKCLVSDENGAPTTAEWLPVLLYGAQTIADRKTFSTMPNLSAGTASQILALDSSKNIQTLTTGTYPSLTELSYVKGVTSAIQTQLGAKQATSNLETSALDTSTTKYPCNNVVKSAVDAKQNLLKVLHVRDEKASGTEGGTFTSGDWRIHTLNTVVTNTITGASLASNRATLPTGTYIVLGYSVGYSCGSNKAKLYDYTNSSDVLIGSNSSSNTSYPSNNQSILIGSITLAAEANIECRVRCSSTQADNGFGNDTAFSVSEVYADLIFVKIL